MKELCTDEIFWMQSAALGPFSYIANWPDDKRTHAQDVTFQSSTYVSMMRLGWAPEVI